MKDQLAKGVRKALPRGIVGAIEGGYRRGRSGLVAARYGYPARGQRVIAVTGTNGKTTTCNYLNEILKASGATTAMYTTAVIELAGEKKINDTNTTVATTARM